MGWKFCTDTGITGLQHREDSLFHTTHKRLVERHKGIFWDVQRDRHIHHMVLQLEK